MSQKQTFNPKEMPESEEFSPVSVNPQIILCLLNMKKMLDSPDNLVAKKDQQRFVKDVEGERQKVSQKQAMNLKKMPDFDECDPLKVNPEQTFSLVQMKSLDFPDDEAAQKTINVLYIIFDDKRK